MGGFGGRVPIALAETKGRLRTDHYTPTNMHYI